MSVNHVLMFAREADQRQAAGFSQPDRERRRRRDGREQRAAHGDRLLNHLITGAARHHEVARAEVAAGASDGTDNLVERVVAANIFPHELDASIR